MTQTKDEVEKAVDTLDIPKGQKVVGLEFFCSKHGKITEAVQSLSLMKIDENGQQIPSVTYICPGCLAEIYQHFQKENLAGKIMIIPQTAPENAKEVEVKDNEQSKAE